jgi:putative transcriptional regulator
MRRLHRAALLISFAGFLAGGASAQPAPSAFFLVADPDMRDPNFRETVVLVTEIGEAQATGVIINRPTNRSLAGLLPSERFKRFTDPIFFGGPVQLNSVLALFKADRSTGEAITMLPGLYLALSPDTIDALISAPPERIRFFAGYSGWAPGQLRSEVERGDWLRVDADPEVIFRKDTSTLWQDMMRRSSAVRADLGALR